MLKKPKPEGKKGKKLLRIAFLLCFPLASLPGYSEESVISSFESLLADGRARDGIEMLVTWLEEHPDSPSFQDVFARYLKEERSIEALRLTLERILGKTDHPSHRLVLLEKLAWIEESAGRLDRAVGYYESASELAQGEARTKHLLAGAMLLYEEGFYDQAAEKAQLLLTEERDESLLGQARILLGYAYLARGSADQAIQEFLPLIGHDPPKNVEPAALLGLVQAHEDSPEKSQEYVQRLERDYSKAPEYALALSVLRTGTKVKFPLSPGRLFLSASRAEKEMPSVGRVMIQTGSFLVRENAEYMLAELIRLKFPAQIKEVTVQDKCYYRVMVGEYTTEEEIQRTITQLKELGFEGFRTTPPE